MYTAIWYYNKIESNKKNDLKKFKKKEPTLKPTYPAYIKLLL